MLTCYIILKGLAHADLAKKLFLHEFILFYIQFFCSINFCFGPLEIWHFKKNCSGIKIAWGSPHWCSYLRNVYTFCCFTHILVDSAYKQLTIALSQARNLFRPNNLSGDLTHDFVNNFVSFKKKNLLIVQCVLHYSG